MQISLYRNLTFEAAHFNPHARPGSPQARVHGHSYQVRVFINGAVDPRMGWLMDFAEIRQGCRSVVEKVDHYLLNELPGLTDASLVGLQDWLTAGFAKAVPLFSKCEVRILGDTALQPRVSERDFEFGFAAAHSLPNVPEDHKCRRLHGHSYRVAISGAGGNSPAVGHAVRKLYPTIGHSVLNDIIGLENPTAEYLSRWLWDRLVASGCDLAQVAVAETCTSGCVYEGKE